MIISLLNLSGVIVLEISLLFFIAYVAVFKIKKTKKKGLLFAGVGFSLFLILSLMASYLPFPLASCLAPWHKRIEGDQGINNAFVCIMAAAHATNNQGTCDVFYELKDVNYGMYDYKLLVNDCRARANSKSWTPRP